MNVTVVALGKIGLPLAVQYARRGLHVVGADIDSEVVGTIRRGSPPFPGEEHLDTYLPQVLASGHLSVTTDTTTAVRDADVVVVVVPLVVDEAKQPDFRALDAATAAIAPGLKPGALVVYETTVPVGSTRQRFAPALTSGSNLSLGHDLFVAYSPERVYSGRIFADLRRYPKLVGGIDDASTKRAVDFYREALDFDERPDLAAANGVWDLETAEAAELAKLAETTYRDINIAFANELARFADQHDIDVTKVIAACNSQPFSHIHQPGIAVGGHCIPVYPHLYLAGDPAARLPTVARAVNDGMPQYAVSRLADSIGELSGKRIAVLGAAYRGGVKESAFSGVFSVVRALEAAGAFPVVHDPLYSDDELAALGLTPHHLGEFCDGAIVQADHEEYRDLSPSKLGGATTVVDGRRVVQPHASLTVITLGSRQMNGASEGHGRAE
jgi:nucleotide sugar dehydrogenase